MGNNNKYVEHMLEAGIVRKSDNWVETASSWIPVRGERNNRESNKPGRLPAYSLAPPITMESMQVLFYRILGDDRTEFWAISKG
jgi:hypothetical protein